MRERRVEGEGCFDDEDEETDDGTDAVLFRAGVSVVCKWELEGVEG